MRGPRSVRLALGAALATIVASCHPVSQVDPCTICPEGARCERAGDEVRCLAPDADADADADTDLDADLDADPERDADPEADGDGCPPPDLPYGGECDPVDQTCCPEGQRCMVAGQGPELCTDIVSPGVDGSPCWDRAEDECGPGTTCVFGGFIASCHAFCRSEADCPQDRAHYCLQIAQGATAYSVCYPGEMPCDPVANTGCRPGETCVLSTEDWSHPEIFTTCVPEGTNAMGERCDDSQGCQAGAACYVRASTRTPECMAFCRRDAPSCPDEIGCRYYLNPDYGVCEPG